MSVRYDIVLVCTNECMEKIGLSNVRDLNPDCVLHDNNFYCVYFQGTKTSFEEFIPNLLKFDPASYRWVETCHDYPDYSFISGELEDDCFEVEVEQVSRIVWDFHGSNIPC